jgi:hypothetical protein
MNLSFKIKYEISQLFLSLREWLVLEPSTYFHVGATFEMRTTLCEMRLLNDPDDNA